MLLIWLVITALLGLFPEVVRAVLHSIHSALAEIDHAHWVLYSILPLILLQTLSLRKINASPDVTKVSEQRLNAYASNLLLMLAFLTGIAHYMGFLPAFWHKLSVWPLIIVSILSTMKHWRISKPTRK